jgi:amidase
LRLTLSTAIETQKTGKRTMRLTRRTLLATVYGTGLAACAPMPKVAAKGGDKGPDATTLAAMIRAKEVSSAEVVDAAIKRCESANAQLGFLVNDTYALARARAKTTLSGPFAGVPWLVKDLNDVTGAVTRHGSRATAGAPPATTQDTYISATFATGLVCIGKSAAPEGGYLCTTEPLAFAPTRNPWNTGYSTAGSSGGAAAAVASGVVPMAHANDGGGSIRFPAANCGLVGLKPSRGRLVHDRPGARPLDIAVQGVVSHTVRDTAGMFAATEASGSGAVYAPVGLVTGPGTKRLKVGVLTKGFAGFEAHPEVAAAVRATARVLEGAGHTIVGETTWPTAATFVDDFLAFWSLGALNDLTEMSKALGKTPDETLFEPFSLRMAENGMKMKPEEIEAVQGRLLAAATAYDTWIKDFDVVLSPVFTSPPSPLGFFRGDVPFDTLRERLTQEVGYTLIHNISGAPGVSLPMGWSSTGLPIGVQVSAANGGEKTLIELSYELEMLKPWAGKRAGVWVN